MQIEVQNITPELAREMLNGNTNNRPLNARHVNYLADEIANCRWKLNGDSIRFNGTQLLDGQHRLNAIIKAGKPVETLVIRGIDSDVFDAIDAGKKRSPAEVLGIRGEKNTTVLAAALRLVTQYFKGAIVKKLPVSTTELESVLEEHPAIRNSISFMYANQGSKIVSKALYVSCHYLFSLSNPELSDDFWKCVASGYPISESNAPMLLRERLIKNVMSKEKLTSTQTMALVIKAWNATLDGKHVGKLRFGDREEFPVIK